MIDGDPIWLRRVLDNLVDNAASTRPIRDRDRGRPAELRGAPGVRIEVINRGAGSPATTGPRVFTPFFRADRSRTRATGGVGLGLALARRIVEAHGGAIAFHSEPDVGLRS